jgi:DNA-binding LytR/AlgR family response regulator
LLISCLIGAFVAVFLIVFKPFDTAGANIPNLNFFLAGYGGIITIITFLPKFLSDLVAPKVFKEANWTVGRQIFYLFCLVSLGISGSYWYLLQAGGQANWSDYSYFFRNGLLVASFPIIVITLLDYIRKLRYYESGAAAMNAQRSAPPPASAAVAHQQNIAPASAPNSKQDDHAQRNVEENAPIQIEVSIHLTDNQQRVELVVPPAQIWCLHSDGNYVEAWTLNEAGGCDRTVIRNTLAGLTSQLPNAPFLTCHRSWVVNTDLVENVSGNAQGYQLDRAGAPTVIVARGRSKAVLGMLQNKGISRKALGNSKEALGK